jgi:hypothetical protein
MDTYRAVALIVSNNLGDLDAKYTKEQILRASRCEYIRNVATIMGQQFNWGVSLRLIRARLVTNSLREANEILYELGIRIPLN